MNQLFLVTVATCIALAAAIGAVELLGDRTFITPPPETVSEQFFNAIETKRWPSAKHHLSKAAAAKISTSDLKSLQAKLQEILGPFDAFSGSAKVVDAKTAETDVELRGPDGKQLKPLGKLSFEGGSWKVDHWQH